MAVKVVFLDIDGVLNNDFSPLTGPFMKTWPDWEFVGLDKRLVAKLSDLLIETGAYVVISSSWRERNTLLGIRARLVSAGLDPRVEIIGYTPVMAHKLSQTQLEMRKFEIADWMREFGDDVTSYVVLDDSPYADTPGHFVHVDRSVGLTDADVATARSILTAGDSDA